MTTIAKLTKDNEAVVSKIKLSLIFDGENVATEETGTILGALHHIDMWRKLYALKKWANRCSITMDFYVKSKKEENEGVKIDKGELLGYGTSQNY